MSPDIPVTTDALARWHVHCLDAWRAMREQRELLRKTEVDREAFREVAQTAMDVLAEVTAAHLRRTERYHALIRELRALRHRGAA